MGAASPAPIFRWTCSRIADAVQNGGSPHPQIRVSTRARRMSVRVYPDARVEVVVPRRARPSEVEQFLTAHREWIETRREAALRNRPAPEPFPPPRHHVRGRRRNAGACTWREARGGCHSANWERTPSDFACCASAARLHHRGLRRGAARLAAACGARAPRAACRRAIRGNRHPVFEGLHPPAALALGKLFGARYHQSQCLPAVPAPGSRRLPHHARAHACETHESFGALLGCGRKALPGLARARS